MTEARLSDLAAAARPTPYLDGLNPEQRRAVETLDGAVLVLAGAGTGKTRALTARIAHILNTGRARPWEVLSVTFTNKAAREMRTRIGGMIGDAVEGMSFLGTFHALCAKMLRRHAELVGLTPRFTILDSDDQLRLLKQLVQAENIDEKRWPPRMLAAFIDRWKNKALSPDRLPEEDVHLYAGKGGALYTQYQERLKTLNAVDFGDLILHMIRILQNNPDVLEKYHRQFRYILVDEYQDSNVAQYLWLRLLAGEEGNICCVGDDDQSIYGWRGAEVGNILKFERDFPGAAIIRLERNYRSTPHILKAAGGVISANTSRLGKELWTDIDDGEKVRLIGHWDGEEEARWIGEEIERHQAGTRDLSPIPLTEMAVLVRAAHQMRAFEDRFLAIGLPYRVIGGPRFYERQEIRDAIAYLRVAAQPEDGLAFERIVNTPKRGLGDKAQSVIATRAREDGIAPLEAARRVVADSALPARAGNALKRLVEDIDRWGATLASDEADHVALAQTILDESGYTAMWQADKSPDAPGRLDNLKELVKALEEFENLTGFLEHISLVMDNAAESAGEQVSIMTLHAAKGLEFDAVFLPGWEDGLFPSQRSLDEGGATALEEERRLAYVGVTRAKQLCVISFAANRRVYGQWQAAIPSRFIDELPKDHVEVLTPPGLGGAAMAAEAPGRWRSSEIEQKASAASVYNSPGWKRMQARGGQAARRESKTPRSSVIEAEAMAAFSLGQRVFHQKFGYGEITAMEGGKLLISFDKTGEKHVVASFVVAAENAAG